MRPSDIIKIPKLECVMGADKAAFSEIAYIKVENVEWCDCQPDTSQRGTLYITNTHMIFASEDGKELWISHCQISCLQRAQPVDNGWPLIISGKIFFALTMIIPKERDCQDIYDSLLALSRPTCIEDLPAFCFVPEMKDLMQSEGWNEINMYDDYARLGLPNDNWTISDLNKNFEVNQSLNFSFCELENNLFEISDILQYCDGYPERIFVPKNVPTPVLIGSSKFRSRGRLPVLSYLHRTNQACICRCSQPLAGFSARCIEDESLMRHIAKTNPHSKTLYIVDTRPKINAIVNKAAGKGFEDERNYSHVRYHFFAVENIHAVRGSLQKMLEVVWNKKNISVSNFLTGLVNSGWLKHIRSLLETAVFVSETVISGTSVVIHCSDGWDRTPQIVSISCILLDPFYRTIKGFETLIEKEWLQFGHKFSDRYGHIYTSDSKELAPVFTQFLEAVWQLTVQYPLEFEFNEFFLLTLHDHLHSCNFGTFLYNSTKDRIQSKVSSRTYSLWGYMSRLEESLRNPLYDPSDIKDILKPDLRPQQINYWRAMYNRYDFRCDSNEYLLDALISSRQQILSLKYHIRYLQEQLNQQREASFQQCCLKFSNLLPKNSTDDNNCAVNGTFVAEHCEIHKMSISSNNDENDVDKNLETFSHPLSAAVSCENKAENEKTVPLIDERCAIALDWASLRRSTRCSNRTCNAKFWPLERRVGVSLLELRTGILCEMLQFESSTPGAWKLRSNGTSLYEMHNEIMLMFKVGKNYDSCELLNELLAVILSNGTDCCFSLSQMYMLNSLEILLNMLSTLTHWNGFSGSFTIPYGQAQ
ncbi:Myotubularin-related protein 6 [Trichinella pseudospiralis]|uniref:Myotubularin-related protein 6 n=1 Tax=Trichinella pseudospiralis TaxID=6337 RepID=A0A0V1JAI5_TRIPS|nr:Myotubularin-related protein 6 [Trichinella pseudospiralis]